MKPFKINRNSWHYKLNQKFFNERGDNIYYMRDNWEPRHNNFCSYWRITMIRLVFAAMIATGAIILLYGAGSVVWAYPWETLYHVSTAIGIIVSVLALAVGGVFIQEKLENRRKAKEDQQPSLFMQKYLAQKSKICPMVEYD